MQDERRKLHKRLRRRKRRRKASLWSLLSVAVLSCATGLLVLSLLGTPIVVPDWLRTRITERINQETGGVQVELGGMVVVVERGWQPTLTLRNIQFKDRSGTPIAALSEISGAVAMRPLFEGKLQPKTIRLSGVGLTLRRARNGELNLSLGNASAQGANLVDLIANVDRALQRTALSTLTNVTAGNLTLRYEDARADRAWNIDGGRIELLRDAESLQLRGDFALLGARDYATTLEMGFASRIGETAAEVSVKIDDMPAGDIAGQSPAMAWLGALDAPISGALRMVVDDQGRLGPLNATLHIGAGVLKPNAATNPVAFTSARSYFTYDPTAQTMQFNELFVDSKWGQLRAEGQALLVGADTGWPTELQAQMQLSDIHANPDNYYPEEILLDAASVDMRLVFDPFHLSLGQLTLEDSGEQLVLNGDLAAVADGWDIALNGKLGGLSFERLMQLWPVAVSSNTREWVARNVETAALNNIELAVRASPKRAPEAFLNFGFTNLTTWFLKEMPPIQEASGNASLYGNRFAIQTDEGFVQPLQGGLIDVSGTSFVVPDVNIRRGPAIAHLRMDSTITAALSLLDHDPLKLLTKVGQPVTLADGRARLDGRLDFLLKPKLTMSEVVFSVTGDLNNVRSDQLVPGRTLAARSLRVIADNDEISIDGDGRLGQVPFTGLWKSVLGEEADGNSHLDGTIEVSQEFADEFGIGLPPGSISGAGRAAIAVDLGKDGAGDFQLSSDLSGVGLRLPQLSWAKPKSAKVDLVVEGSIGTPPKIDRLMLDAPGLRAEGAVTLRTDGQLERATFSSVKVGGWLDAPVTLIGRGKNLTPAVEVTGGSVDLRRTSLSSGEGSTTRQGGPVRLRLDRLQISDGIALTEFAADLDTRGGTSGQFSGKVNGGAMITGTILPEKGRSAFRVVSQDAGGVMRSAGLLKQARGGTMELILRPSVAEGTYNGILKAGQVWLTDAPAMAALLNTLSIVGLLEQLTGNGILFGAVEAQFTLSPEQLTLYSSSAVGASMGITMDGYYFMSNGVMDMQGVISPIYLVNGLGGVLTRKGEGLVGFNYKLKGLAANPKVKILPLTLFTPGMFRDIFRRAPPGAKKAEKTGRSDPKSQPFTQPDR